MQPDTEALIIGAGPAGLALAACLAQRHIPSIVVEQAATVGAPLHQHYERLHLHSDREHSAQPYLCFPRGTQRYPSRAQVLAYLERYARTWHIEPRFGERAKTIRRNADGWITDTSAAAFHSRSVIVATGLNATPVRPR
jgi:cation diffusion facilitator CzcD-associated flavoprotein CzcO